MTFFKLTSAPGSFACYILWGWNSLEPSLRDTAHLRSFEVPRAYSAAQSTTKMGTERDAQTAPRSSYGSQLSDGWREGPSLPVTASLSPCGTKWPFQRLVEIKRYLPFPEVSLRRIAWPESLPSGGSLEEQLNLLPLAL